MKERKKKMAKTIRVIDLLNKIANGEDVPIEVKWKNHIYKFNGLAYISVKSYSDNFYCLGYMHGEGNLLNCLNDTVEIIEEQQDIDIQEIEEINHYNICSVNRLKTEENINDELSKSSLIINKLVQAVKQLDKNIKDKE